MSAGSNAVGAGEYTSAKQVVVVDLHQSGWGGSAPDCNSTRAAAAAVDAAAADLCAPPNEPNMQPLTLSDEVAANYSSWLRE
jgi:hypothetical protein